jgi:hypothetical protein
MDKPRVLIACEYSGTVREAFAALGCEAWSCDLLPSKQPGNHIQGDALSILGDGWDLLVAHPPCQYLSYAGVRHWNKPGRAGLREAAMQFFMQMVNAPIPHICVENPRGYPHQAYRLPDQVIHPYMFGDAAMKRTSLWLKNLPKLWYWDKPGSLFDLTAVPKPQPVSVDSTGKQRHFTDGSTRKAGERARTFPGIAQAMAQQWTQYLLDKYHAAAGD